MNKFKKKRKKKLGFPTIRSGTFFVMDNREENEHIKQRRSARRWRERERDGVSILKVVVSEFGKEERDCEVCLSEEEEKFPR